MYPRQVRSALWAASVLVSAWVAQAATVNVPGTSDPWLAGMPDGSSASLGDLAPGQSPVLVPLALSAGDQLFWSASGQVSHPGDAADPDGKPPLAITTHATGAENGISDITVPIDSLLGVFLGPGQPNLSPAPGALDFSTVASRNYLTSAPVLQQVFFMGNGQTDAAQDQAIVVPAGATRLFLGTMDGYGWANNLGSFDVSIRAADGVGVPEVTSTLGLLTAAVMGVFGFRRQVRQVTA